MPLVFPLGCTFFRGPHSMECYRSIWDEVGCLDSGWMHPDNITYAFNQTLAYLNLKYVRFEMPNNLNKCTVMQA